MGEGVLMTRKSHRWRRWEWVEPESGWLNGGGDINIDISIRGFY